MFLNVFGEIGPIQYFSDACANINAVNSLCQCSYKYAIFPLINYRYFVDFIYLQNIL